MQVNNMLLPDGEEALFYPDSRLRWSDKPAGGQWARESASDDGAISIGSGASPTSVRTSRRLGPSLSS